jgi:hypothetical protein
LKTKIVSSTFKNALAFYSAGVDVVNSKFVELAPGTDVMILKKNSPKNSAKKLAFSTQNRAK